MRNIGIIVVLISTLVAIFSWRGIENADKYIERNNNKTMINLAVATTKYLFMDDSEKESEQTLSWGLNTLNLDIASAEELRDYRSDKVFSLSVSLMFIIVGLGLAIFGSSDTKEES